MKRPLLFLLTAALTGCAPCQSVSGRIAGLTNDTLQIASCAIADIPDLEDDSDERITYDTVVAEKGRLA